jgi:glycosyltransferase involved in cell wall biosynthesis
VSSITRFHAFYYRRARVDVPELGMLAGDLIDAESLPYGLRKQFLPCGPLPPEYAHLEGTRIIRMQRAFDEMPVAYTRVLARQNKALRAPSGLSEVELGHRAFWTQHEVEEVALPTGKACIFYTGAIGGWGGVQVLFDLALGLRKLGVNAHIVTCREQDHVFPAKLAPWYIQSPASLPALLRHSFPEGGIVFATHWGSAEVLLPIARMPGWQLGTYYQDREDLFEDTKGRKSFSMQSALIYHEVGNRVFNASWIKEELGLSGAVIPVGFHGDVFCPVTSRRRGLVGMHRPITPRRGAALLNRVFDAARAGFRSKHTVSFGDDVGSTADEVHGQLTPSQVHQLLARAELVIEPSSFQGFGLVGLEGIASGTPVLSLDNKGIREYASVENAYIARNEQELIDVALAFEQHPYSPEDIAATVARFEWKQIAAQWKRWLDDRL